jgi:hypothetical protein
MSRSTWASKRRMINSITHDHWVGRQVVRGVLVSFGAGSGFIGYRLVGTEFDVTGEATNKSSLA